MEYETFVSGIGGQGIQLISKMFAVAAMANGRHVMLNGVYGGEMRGGKSLATVVMGVEPLRTLPVTAQASAAVVLHGNFWEAPRERLRANALILAHSEISAQLAREPGQMFVEVAATRMARAIGNPLVGGMILMSTFATATGLVTTEQLLAAMRSLVPPHRTQHIAANEQAIYAGAIEPLSHQVILEPIAGRQAA